MLRSMKLSTFTARHNKVQKSIHKDIIGSVWVLVGVGRWFECRYTDLFQ